jgi:hypothetical protein
MGKEWSMFARGFGLLALVATSLGWGLADSPAGAKEKRAGSKNTVEIRKVGKDKVEVTVTSDKPFPVVNAYPVLSIGAQRSSVSRVAKADGSTNALIFTMSAKSFAKTKNGNAIRVRYSPDSQGVWEFGKLDKSKLKK